MLKRYKINPYSIDIIEFEFDQAKSDANREKHGIDFDEAMELWVDKWCVTAKAKTRGEPRSLLIARYAGLYWSAIFTIRSTAIRIISVRLSTKEERAIYDRRRNDN